MTAHFSPPVIPFVDHDEALRWAKEWRSDCLDAFAMAETNIGKLLKALACQGKVKLGQPTRASFDHLRERLEAKGHWKVERRRFNQTLESLDRLLEFRAQLAHGELGVWRGIAGQWLLTLNHPDGHCAGPIRWHAYPLAEAALRQRELRIEVQQFAEGADELIARLPANTKP